MQALESFTISFSIVPVTTHFTLLPFGLLMWQVSSAGIREVSGLFPVTDIATPWPSVPVRYKSYLSQGLLPKIPHGFWVPY